MSEFVYSVHVAPPDDIGAVEVMFHTEAAARRYAKDRSGDHLVLSSSVSRFALGELGTRTSISWYQDGAERHPRAERPGRLYPSACGDSLE